jgi:leucyl/phenylalanyl-tRNA---protein transferase
MPIFHLSDAVAFPPAHFARKDGLLAVGGDLSPRRLILGYKMGVFPWFSEGDPICWWSPDPRLVLDPSEIRISRSLKKVIKKNRFEIRIDSAFEEVIENCAGIRSEKREGTWITPEMIQAYRVLHESGWAHSFEAWFRGELVGGLYGVGLGGVFFGESMFSKMSDSSKAALAALGEYAKKYSIDMIDCQMTTAHLMSFGAREIPRAIFLERLKQSLSKRTRRGHWG